eukprot:GHVO01040909.1.p3 GENE.GHVO01040909.1~~GHVO01040909.1.p3  ORF type:complete len:122 (-),score=48.97 GHVO01040909.1:74-439(-)
MIQMGVGGGSVTGGIRVIRIMVGGVRATTMTVMMKRMKMTKMMKMTNQKVNEGSANKMEVLTSMVYDTVDVLYDTVDVLYDTVDVLYDTVDVLYDTVDVLYDTPCPSRVDSSLFFPPQRPH